MTNDKVKIQISDVLTFFWLFGYFVIAELFHPLGKIGGWVLLIAIVLSGIGYYTGIKRESILKLKVCWVGIFIENSFAIPILVLEFLDLNRPNLCSYIFAISLVILFTGFFMWSSNKCFNTIGRTICIIVVSSFGLVFLSYIFSLYYKVTYNLNYTFDYNESYAWIKPFNIYWSFGKNSLSGFFEFPTREYLDIVSFAQFIVGQFYEAVVIVGIANIITNKLGLSEKEKKDVNVNIVVIPRIKRHRRKYLRLRKIVK